MPSPNKEKSVPVTPPNYETLSGWWDTWSQGRPELLDFWARGNFTRRLLDRKANRRAGCIVRVQYIDEMDLALRRLALLGIEVDFAWAGPVSPPELVMAPQHIAYEDAGGWGYSTCSGDEIDDGSGKWEWCPTFGFASLLPDTVTDWMATDAADFFKAGQMMVYPMENIGLRETPAQESDEHLGALGNSISISRTASLAKVLFELDLPVLEGMPLRDTYAFCEDNGDSLARLRVALAKLVGEGSSTIDDEKLGTVVAEIRDAVAEFRLSDSSLSARKTLTALGASISTFGITVGLQLGLAAGTAAIGSVAAAMATLALWHRNIEAEGGLKTKPYYAIWKLQGNDRRKAQWRARTGPWSVIDKMKSLHATPPVERLPPYHWLTKPTPGWLMPTAFVPT